MAEARADQDQMEASPAGNRPTGTHPAQPPERDKSGASAPDLPRWASIFRPLVDAIAGIPVSVHAKLLSGFLLGALLLLAMGVLSLVILDRMNQRVDELARLQEKVDRSRQMEYLVTAQSHY